MRYGSTWTNNDDSKHGKNTTSSSYYYMWRFGWVFYLMGLVFAVLAFFTAMLAACSRLGSYLGALMTTVALFFFTLGASLMTYVHPFLSPQFHSTNASLTPSSPAPNSSKPATNSAITESVPVSVAGPLVSHGPRGLVSSSP